MTARVRTATRTYRPQGSGAKRLALWVALVGLPLAEEFSDRLPGERAYLLGDPSRWFAGLQLDLALAAVGAAVVAFVLWRDREGLASIGWPARLPHWQLALAAGTIGLAVIAALFYRPPTVSTALVSVSASSPVTRLERISLVGAATAEALVQETLWRGAVIAWLRPVVGAAGAVAVSTASFVFLHPHLGIGWAQLALRLPLALLYAALARWGRNVAPSAYVHFLLTAGQLLAPLPG